MKRTGDKLNSIPGCDIKYTDEYLGNPGIPGGNSSPAFEDLIPCERENWPVNVKLLLCK